LVGTDKLALRYESARNHWGRLTLIAAAQKLTLNFRFSDRSKVRGTREWEEKIAADPRSLRVCEVVHGVPRTTLARIRKRYRTLRAVPPDQASPIIVSQNADGEAVPS
jgi:hypothetical protein